MDVGTMFLVEFIITIIATVATASYFDKIYDAAHPDDVIKKPKKAAKEA